MSEHSRSIPHIFHIIPSFAHGGVPIRLATLINHFGNRARHSLLSTNGDYACLSRIENQNNVTIIPMEGADRGNLIRRLMACRAIIRGLNPDLLLTYQWGSVEWAMANSLFPVCGHYHLESGFGPEEAEKTLPRRDLFRRLALRNVQGVIVPSRTLMRICAQNWKIGKEKIIHIANGVDCDKYAAQPDAKIIEGFVPEKDALVIGTMTPLRAEKNLPRLIAAFNAVCRDHPQKKLSLIILGEGPERTRLEHLIARSDFGRRIHLAGHIDAPEKALGLLDIYALTSHTEQMPNAVNQAMAAALPVVGLDVGDVKHMVSPANKDYIVAAANTGAFRAALGTLIQNEGQRIGISQANKLHVKATYDQCHMFEAYGKIWGVE